MTSTIGEQAEEQTTVHVLMFPSCAGQQRADDSSCFDVLDAWNRQTVDVAAIP